MSRPGGFVIESEYASCLFRDISRIKIKEECSEALAMDGTSRWNCEATETMTKDISMLSSTRRRWAVCHVFPA